jgi:hypothetical protein
MLVFIGLLVLGAGAFVAGILVGRRNKSKVEAVVATVKDIERSVEKNLK